MTTGTQSKHKPELLGVEELDLQKRIEATLNGDPLNWGPLDARPPGPLFGPLEKLQPPLEPVEEVPAAPTPYQKILQLAPAEIFKLGSDEAIRKKAEDAVDALKKMTGYADKLTHLHRASPEVPLNGNNDASDLILDNRWVRVAPDEHKQMSELTRNAEESEKALHRAVEEKIKSDHAMQTRLQHVGRQVGVDEASTITMIGNAIKNALQIQEWPELEIDAPGGLPPVRIIQPFKHRPIDNVR